MKLSFPWTPFMCIDRRELFLNVFAHIEHKAVCSLMWLVVSCSLTSKGFWNSRKETCHYNPVINEIFSVGCLHLVQPLTKAFFSYRVSSLIVETYPHYTFCIYSFFYNHVRCAYVETNQPVEQNFFHNLDRKSVFLHGFSHGHSIYVLKYVCHSLCKPLKYKK